MFRFFNFYTFIVCLHVFLFASIFDIYFTSPLIHDVSSIPPKVRMPAKRLVLFIADGLRSDKLYENSFSTTPFLKYIITRKGVHGYSHTHVPTESRPGHVAIIAGFYEDVASVTKGWQENAVPFDSVFNQSRNTWSWGSPDILPMFAKNVARKHIFTDMYSAEEEKFGAADSSLLDKWVFEKFKAFWAQESQNKTSKIYSSKVVFFFHLLGMDTCGHSKKPHSKLCEDNLRLVDNGIREINELMETVYNDDETSFVFTSDHGMTDWGSHGSGHQHETSTPFIAWGAGVSKSVSNILNFNQADIAPLMSILLNINIPVNSVGIVPISALNVSDKNKAVILKQNAEQLQQQFQAKRAEKYQKSISFLFHEFSSELIEKQYLEKGIKLLDSGNDRDAIHFYHKLCETYLEGITYYHKYDRVFHGFCISVTFILMMIHTYLEANSKSLYFYNLCQSQRVNLTFLGIYLLELFVLFVESRPFFHWLYLLVPTILFHTLIVRLQKHRIVVNKSVLPQYFCLFLMIQLLVIGFFYRQSLFVAAIFLSFWPFYLQQWTTTKIHWRQWLVANVCIAVFPLLPVAGSHVSLLWILLGGISLVTSFIMINKVLLLFTKKSFFIKLFLLIKSSSVCLFSHTTVLHEAAIPIVSHTLSWIILVLGYPISLWQSSSNPHERFSSVIAYTGSVLILLTTTYEAVFYSILFYIVSQWVILEEKLDKIEDSAFRSAAPNKDLRRAFVFIFYSIFSFFGTGNIASINTFNPSTVYPFLTTFRPFVMGALMMLKLSLPLLAVAAGWALIQRNSSATSTRRSALLCLLLADVASLNFFFLVRDHGSWLEIGTSISHYVISMAQTVVLLMMALVARALLFCYSSDTASKLYCRG